MGGQVSWFILEKKKTSLSLHYFLCLFVSSWLMGREQSVTIAVWMIYLLFTLIVHLAHFLVVILISWENYSDVWQTDLSLGRLTVTLLYLFCPRPTKGLRLTVLDCTNYTKDGAFLCCDAARPLRVLTIHNSLSQHRAWSYGYGVCISLCIKPAVLIHEHLKVAPHESCSVWESETMLSRFWGCAVVKPASGRD